MTNAYTVEGYTQAIWAEINRLGLLENNGANEAGHPDSSFPSSAHAMEVQAGESELADWVQEVASCLADGDRDEAQTVAGGNPRVVAALGHNPIPIPKD